MLFEVTRLSLAYFEDKLQVSYKFSKYDYCFVHELPEKGMENAGLVTFDDSFLQYFSEDTPKEKVVFLVSGLAH